MLEQNICQAELVKAIYYKFLLKVRNSIWKIKTTTILEGREIEMIALSEILFCISFSDMLGGHSISYMRLDDDQETRRLTIDLLRYRVEQEFPSLDPRNSQCGLWKHLSHLYNANFYEKKLRGYFESLLFLTSSYVNNEINLEFTGYYSEIHEAI